MTINTTVRDSQRQRVYDAEDIAAMKHQGTRFRQTIPNADLQKFVDKVYRRATFRRRWPHKHVPAVRLGRGGGWANVFDNTISVGTQARNPWFLLHEIAHLLCPGSCADHGPEFAGIMLWLVRDNLGPEAAEFLREAYRTKRVRKNTKALPAPADRIESAMQARLTKIKAERDAATKALSEVNARLRAAQEEIRTYRLSKAERSAA